ncbi:hypothetical protein PFISCL1PPCAC_14253, partial [Pristionchus fissidentatus]
MDILRRYPIYPGFCFVLYTSYLLPVGLLLVVLQRSLLQANCRIILTVWAIGMIGILTNEIYLMYVNMTLTDGEFISKTLQEPAHRPAITIIHSIFYICMSALELLLSLERVGATRAAESVLEPLSTFWYLIPYLAGWIVFAWYTASLAFIEFNMLVICITFNTVDISSIVTNLVIYRYCKRRYVTMLGRSSLSERYQVTEKSSVIIYTYASSVFLQFTAAVMTWIYAIYNDQVPYFLLEAVYQILHATNCAASSVILMYNHPRMQREALKILRKW